MNGTVQSTFAIITFVEIIVGYLGNGFIALVNFMDWVKRRRISTTDQILSALAIFRIVALCIGLISTLVLAFSPDLFITEGMLRLINVTWMVTNHFTLWLSTSLNTFYFLKIANFSNSTFLYLQWRVKKVVSKILLVSLFFLFLNIALASKHTDVWSDAYKKNISYNSKLREFGHIFKTLTFINCLSTFLPFILSVTNLLLLIFSMWKHLKKMQHVAKGCTNASTAAHMKALQTGFASLLFNIIFFLVLIIQIASFEFLGENFAIMYDQVIGVTFHSSHTFVLILGNSKLRQASLSVLRWLRYRSKHTESPGQ
ncbi:PREDICTED: taste receptor type 2 member 14-like [Chinchilla lanigera]|uniref:taste receptor type 2 member 14-like n=1 Tax=Chinchilla lanigera TaxID=34839 RepID=UPI00038ECBCC|nr:PREDICTED: taste receptor type 2 member 14-like [Chinchilla lanigera]